MTDPLSKVLPNVPAAKGQPNYITYTNQQAWWVSLPAPYTYLVWQPWLKQFEGGRYRNVFESHAPGGWSAAWLWIDQELKKAMGR